MRHILAALAFLLGTASTPALPEKAEFQLLGKVMKSDGKPFRGVTPVVFLQGSVTPFVAQTLAGPDGKFKFKNLLPASYTLIVSVPRTGESRKTIEVGPSFADSKKRVAATVTFDRASPFEKRQIVSAVELSIPMSAQLEYQRAQEHLSRREIEGAVVRLKKAVEIAPQFSVALNQLGTIAYQSGQYQQAEEYFREALKQDAEAYSPLVNLGGALLSQGRIKESLPINQAAVKAKPADALAHSQLGQSHFFLGQLDDAESHLKRAKALDPSHFSYPQLTLIEIHARRNKLPEAIAEIEEFLKLHPDSQLAPKLRTLLESARAKLPVTP